MKNKSIFRIFGLIAFVGLLFGASYFTSPGTPAASLSDQDSNNVAIAQPVADTVATVVTLEPVVVASIKQEVNKEFDLKTITKKRNCIKNYMASKVGQREKTDRNDGKYVDQFFSNIGWKNASKLKETQKYWCGAFMGSAWLECLDSIPFVKSNRELAQVRKWEKGPKIDKRDAEPGDALTLKGYSHVEGLFDRHPNPTFKFCTIIGGNTSPASNDPDQRGGVFKKTRMWSEVKSVISVKKTIALA